MQGSAGYVEGSLAGRRADVAYLDIGQLGVQSEAYIEAYWHHTVAAVRARRVVLTRLAAEQGVALHLPTVHLREDPWAGLLGA